MRDLDIASSFAAGAVCAAVPRAVLRDDNPATIRLCAETLRVRANRTVAFDGTAPRTAIVPDESLPFRQPPTIAEKTPRKNRNKSPADLVRPLAISFFLFKNEVGEKQKRLQGRPLPCSKAKNGLAISHLYGFAITSYVELTGPF